MFGMIFRDLDLDYLQVLSCLKCMLILVKLSEYLNQKYLLVFIYYGKEDVGDIICIKMVLKWVNFLQFKCIYFLL